MQPGMLSGKIDYNNVTESVYKNIMKYMSGTKEGNAYLVELVTADMTATGIDFIPYADGMSGGYKVALVVKPGEDYHWYRQDSDGTWPHKQGQMDAIQDVGYYNDRNGKLQ